MHKFIQFYYDNRLKVWAVILAIIFIIVIIQVLNGFAGDERENNNQNGETTRKCCFL